MAGTGIDSATDVFLYDEQVDHVLMVSPMLGRGMKATKSSMCILQ